MAIIRRKRAHQRVDQRIPGTSIIVYYEQDSRKKRNRWHNVGMDCGAFGLLDRSRRIRRLRARYSHHHGSCDNGFAIGKLHLLEPVLRHHYSPRHTKSEEKIDR